MKHITASIALALAVSLGLGSIGSASGEAAPTQKALPVIEEVVETYNTDNIVALSSTKAEMMFVTTTTTTTTTTLPPTTTTVKPAPTTTVPAPVVVTTTAPPAPPVNDSGGQLGDPYYIPSWDHLRQCEAPDWAGGWSANTGNGYYGGIQFSLNSWRAVGGTGYPHEHSREEQIRRGQMLWELQGWGAWPACTRKFGWR